MKKNCLITGGAGFIGSHLVEALSQVNRVTVLDDLSKGSIRNLSGTTFTLIQKDVSSDELDFSGFDIIYHLACSKNTVCMKSPQRDLEVNALGTLRVLEAARKANVKRFIHVSTGSVYGKPIDNPQTEKHPLNPVSYYGVSKLAGEKYAMLYYKLHGLPVTVCRYYHVYGPRQDFSDEGGVVAIFVDRMYQGKPLTIYGSGKQLRCFTYVKDTVNATIHLADRRSTIGQVYNIVSDIRLSIENLFKILHGDCKDGKTVKVIYAGRKTGDIDTFNPDNSKLLKTGFNFEYNLLDGLKETVTWRSSLK